MCVNICSYLSISVNAYKYSHVYVDENECDAHISPCVLIYVNIFIFMSTDKYGCDAPISPCVLMHVIIFMFM